MTPPRWLWLVALAACFCVLGAVMVSDNARYQAQHKCEVTR